MKWINNQTEKYNIQQLKLFLLSLFLIAIVLETHLFLCICKQKDPRHIRKGRQWNIKITIVSVLLSDIYWAADPERGQTRLTGYCRNWPCANSEIGGARCFRHQAWQINPRNWLLLLTANYFHTSCAFRI